MAISPELLGSLIQAGGGLLTGLGANKNSEADREQQQRALIAQFLTGQQQNQTQAAQAAVNATGGPTALGDALTKARIKRDLLANVTMPSVQAPASAAPYVGQVNTGFRLPANGFNLSGLSEPALGEGVKTYLDNIAQLNPHGVTPDTGAYGLNPAVGQGVESSRINYKNSQNDQRDQIMSYLTGATNADGTPHQEDSGGSSWWKKLLGIGLPIAGALAIPGVGGIIGSAAGRLVTGGNPFKIPRAQNAPTAGQNNFNPSRYIAEELNR